jgi:hypothetical protein
MNAMTTKRFRIEKMFAKEALPKTLDSLYQGWAPVSGSTCIGSPKALSYFRTLLKNGNFGLVL